MEKPESGMHNGHEIYTSLEGGILNMRPGADDFLKTLSHHYELIIFTAAM